MCKATAYSYIHNPMCQDPLAPYKPLRGLAKPQLRGRTAEFRAALISEGRRPSVGIFNSLRNFVSIGCHIAPNFHHHPKGTQPCTRPKDPVHFACGSGQRAQPDRAPHSTGYRRLSNSAPVVPRFCNKSL